ncbi:MAG: MIP/aquaporin family protein [Pseudomonadota bacterium]
MKNYVAEFLGTAFLLATVIGSGIMGDALSPDNAAVALLGNTIPTGAILFVLITTLGPISGAHFNPAVTLAFWMRRQIATREALIYVVVQIVGGCLGVILANIMFDLDAIMISEKVRASSGQYLSEVIATFGLVFVIFAGIKYRPKAVPTLVGLYITAAYWFTASTSFANPAVTIARTLSDTFAGITPSSVPAFLAAQIVGAVLAVYTLRALAIEEET